MFLLGTAGIVLRYTWGKPLPLYTPQRQSRHKVLAQRKEENHHGDCHDN